MAPTELRDSLTQQPFEPFRLVLSDGATYDIRHPDLLWVGQRAAYVGLTGQAGSTFFERTVKVDLLHVTQIVPIETESSPPNGTAAKGGGHMKRCYSCWTTWDDAPKACPFCGGLRVNSRHSPSPLEGEVLTAVTDRLAEITAPLVVALRTIARAAMPDGTYLIDFEAHPGEFRSDLAVRWDPMDAEVTQLDGGASLLEDAGPLLAPRLYRPPFDKIDVASLAFHALPVWFAGCWIEAGGGQCLYRAYLSEHDSGLAFDLVRKTWDIYGERWPAEPGTAAGDGA